MSIKYTIIDIFTSEEARWKGAPLYDALLDHMREVKVAARSIVTRGLAGTYENGELATNRIEVLMYNMPIRVEIILPSAELNAVLPGIQDMVTDGIVALHEVEVVSHKVRNRLIPRQMKVRDAMTSGPKSVNPGTSVSDVIRLLLSSPFDGVPVVDAADKPVGIITQNDLITRAGMPIRIGLLEQLEEGKLETYMDSLSGKTAGDIMTKPVVTVEQEKTLPEAVDVMLSHHLKRLPVVDDNGVLVGMLSRVDVFHTVTRERTDWDALRLCNVDVSGVRYVRDIMRRDMHAVQPDTTVEEIIQIIDSSDIQRVVVVDKDDRLLGLISDSDLLSAFSAHPAGVWDFVVRELHLEELGRRHRELVEQIRTKTAAQVMRKDLITVHEDTPVDEAIRLMAEHSIKRLPVVDDDGKFKGMVSRDSVLRAGLGK